MSKEVDEKVVEMRFDNKQFESNVQTSMSTLDKLKQKLNLSGASKGLENINSSVKNVNMSPLGNAVESVHAKFSALQVMGVTALANITNSAVNAGKRIVSALTIDPVKSGFQEYETQINSIQTILANTQKEGTTVKKVNDVLDELNTYADKTIYNFSEMTRNIGTFTAAGVKLDTSVNAIQGIANLAAVSGSTSQQASTAMYQLSQALASGTVKLMDWNSVVNAGMGGQVFQDALKETSKELGTGAEAAIKANGSFRESLSTGWLTSKVLTETLKKFTTSGATEYVAKYTGLSKDAVQAALDSAKAQYGEADAIDQAAKALAKKSGKSEAEIRSTLQFAQTAEDAATKVKTFSQLIDTLKEALGSGWATTWRTIIGDFDEAKNIFTNISDFLGKIINRSSKARNDVLEGALSSNPFAKMAQAIEKADASIKTVTASTKKMGDIVNKVIVGDFGNGEERFKALTKAGYNWKEVQNKVNEQLGNSYKYTVKSVNAQKASAKSTVDLITSLVKLSDAQLKHKGYTDDEVKALRTLQQQSEKTGIPIKELIKDTDKLSGRSLLIDSFKNMGKAIMQVFSTLKKAWKEIFPPKSTEEKSLALYNMIAALHKFSTTLKMNKDTVDKLKRSFKGLFAIIDIIRTIAGGGLKIAFKLINAVLKAFDLNVLDVTANVGDAIVAFRNWLLNDNLLVKSLSKLASGIKMAVVFVKKMVKSFLEIPAVNKTIENFKSVSVKAFKSVRDAISKFIEGIKDGSISLKGIASKFIEVGQNIVAGLIKGISSGSIVDTLIEFGKKIIETVKNVLGIHSPSVEFYNIGVYIVEGLLSGIKGAIDAVLTFVGDIAYRIADIVSTAIKKIPWGTIFSGAMSIGLLSFIKNLAGAFKAIANVANGFGDMMSGVGNVLNAASKGVEKVLKNTAKVVKSFSKVLNSFAFSIKAKAIKDIAISLAILVGAIIVLTFFDPKKLWNAVAIVGVLAGVLIALAALTNKMSSSSATISKDGVAIDGMKQSLLKIGAAILLLGLTVKLIGSMSDDEAARGFSGLFGIISSLILLMAAYGKLVTGKSAKNMDKAAMVLKQLSTSVLLLAIVAKLIAGMTWGEMGRAAAGLVGLVVVVALLVLITKKAEKNIDSVGKVLLAISASMAILTIVAKIIAGMSWGEMFKAAAGLVGLVGVVALLVLITKKVKEDAPKIAATLLALSASIAILAAVAVALGYIPLEKLAQGIIAVGILAAFMAGLILATKNANDCKGNLIAMSIAIGVMTAAVIALSFVKPTKLAGAVAALGILMTIFAIAVKVASTAKSSIAPLIVMTVAVGVIGTVLYLLATLPIESTIAAAASLCVLLLTLVGVLKIISGINSVSVTALAAMAVLTLIVAALGGILYLLSGMQCETALAIAASLSELLLAMSVSLKIISKVPVTGAIEGALGLAAFIGVMAVVLAALGGLSKIPGFNELITDGGETLALIGKALGKFIGSIVGGIAEGISSSLPQIGLDLSKFMVNATPFIMGVKMVDSSVLEGAGYLAGAIAALSVAELIEGIASIVSFGSSFADLGTDLSQFMINATPFIMGASLLNATMMEGVKTLAETVLILTAANVIEGLTSWLTGGSSLADFGAQLPGLGTNIASFAKNLGTFGDAQIKTISCAASAIKAMAQVAQEIPNTGGLLAELVGDNDIGDFGSKLPDLGTNIASFAKNLGTFGEDQIKTVSCASKAIKAMAEAAQEIPNEGGWLSKIVGENDIGTFAKKLPEVATNLISFAKNLGTVGEDQIKSVQAGANAIKAMAEAAQEIPNEGGWISKIVGDNDIADFSGKLPDIGTNLKDFAKNLGTFGDSQIKTIECASGAIKAMASAADALPNDGGWLSKIVGDNNIATFGEKLPGLGTNLSDFANNLGTFGEDKISTITCALGVITSLADQADTLKDAGSGVDYFGDNLSKIAGHLSSYMEQLGSVDKDKLQLTSDSIRILVAAIRNTKSIDVSGVESFKSAIDKLKDIDFGNLSTLNVGNAKLSAKCIEQLARAINSLSNINTKGVGSFKKAINSLSTISVDDMVDKFSKASSRLSSVGSGMIDALVEGMEGKEILVKTTALNLAVDIVDKLKSKNDAINKAGSTVITKFIKGIEDKTGSVKTATSKVVSSAVTAISDKYTNFYNNGKYLGSGLVLGIEAKEDAVYDAAYKLGQKAVQGEKDGQKSNSPSKLTIQAGKWLGEGLVIGINKMERSVYKAGHNMGENAVDPISQAISNISKVINSDVDAQPTIRPVMDLSDVESGAKTINGLLGNGVPIGTYSNLRMINSMMNERAQNGSNNADVVNAINKLNKKLDNVGNTYNSINGVTYDDGSNIHNAIGEIVRAARIERRR